MSSQHTPLSAECQALSNPWANRRASVRYPCQARTCGRLTVVGQCAARRASIQDLSLGGVALWLPRPLEAGTRLLIQLHNDALGLTYALAARVAHSTQLNSRRWIVGCSFSRKLTALELESLL